ncbi:SGNH/GDSL hydrolase family protein [Fibrella sp. WM1]|uniref:SGNH/GDSL hydrolase family protein n=1 Tax=Fibrella musci TaxID=3242485 RepID=UPI0035211D49
MLLFSEEINALEKKVKATPTGQTVFYGSSSIRLWTNLERDFPHIETLNLGFGGSTLAACAWHFERLVVPARPRALILYAGDNDLGEGRQPEEVCLFFRDLARQIEQHLPEARVSFLSIKPSPARWQLVDSIRLANRFIADDISRRPQFQFIDATVAMLTPDGQPDHSLYEADGLHLSPAGYARWREQLVGYMK